MPGDLNWWIGMIFAVGASLFALGSIVSLWPKWTRAIGLAESEAGLIFFLGSIPFTTAAYLQLFQAANADPIPGDQPSTPQRTTWIGWKPGDLGWLSCFLQFIGTVLFNVNTFDGMMPSLSWQQQDVLIWVPNILGSILFMASGYLAFIEAAHAYWKWELEDLSWWVVFVNLLGCIGFLISAVLAIVLPGDTGPWHETASVCFTLIGAICFFWGSVLMLPEAVPGETSSL
ncbi:hypothetical protein [Bremerella cremea]|uniref:hypothetical protein n=1 Tax=Bremerella cremea TaxID=1031537 RepID=UPI0031F140A1